MRRRRRGRRRSAFINFSGGNWGNGCGSLKVNHTLEVLLLAQQQP